MTAAGDTVPAAGAAGWRELRMLLVIWLVVCAVKVGVAMPALGDRLYIDPDDAMRLLQVRDLLAGQSWFDVSQHRLNPPFGAPMHWSRLVDLPIAAVILLFRPLVGQYHAETAALILVPMLTLGAAMLLVHRIASRLANARAALLAVIATPASPGAMTQMQVMRIDHHGWQIVLALGVMLAALDRRPLRSALLAGGLMGLWLNVSLEGLPFAAATGAWFALRWLGDPSEALRLRAYLAALAASAALLFALTHRPSLWLDLRYHDTLNAGHLAAFAAAAAVAQLAVAASRHRLGERVAVLAGIAAAAAAAIFVVDPNCLQSPFAFLDPLVRKLWFDAVDEGQPVWRLARKDAAVALAQPLVGLAGAAFALTRAEERERGLWAAYTFLLGAATLAAISVVREATLASVLSLPGTAFACEYALSRARKLSRMPVRAMATAGALCIMTPAYAVPAGTMGRSPEDGQPDFSVRCTPRSQLAHLDSLPPAIIAAPLDITPAILANSRHTAIGSGHHRNVSGIKDMILLFVGSTSDQREVIARRHIDYVAFCPGTSEAGWWAANKPGDLADLLSRNRAPAWLEPVHVEGMHALKLWRVRKGAPELAGG